MEGKGFMKQTGLDGFMYFSLNSSVQQSVHFYFTTTYYYLHVVTYFN